MPWQANRGPYIPDTDAYLNQHRLCNTHDYFNPTLLRIATFGVLDISDKNKVFD